MPIVVSIDSGGKVTKEAYSETLPFDTESLGAFDEIVTECIFKNVREIPVAEQDSPDKTSRIKASTEAINQAILEVLNTQSKGLGASSVWDILADVQQKEVYKKWKEALDDGIPPAIVKINLAFTEDLTHPCGVNLFLIPPGAKSLPHSHKPKGYSCSPHVLSQTPITEHRFDHLPGACVLRPISEKELRRESEVDVIYAGDRCGKDDVHVLASSIQEGVTEKLGELLKQMESRGVDDVSLGALFDELGVGASIHPYTGCAPKESSVNMVFCAIATASPAMTPLAMASVQITNSRLEKVEQIIHGGPKAPSPINFSGLAECQARSLMYCQYAASP